MQERNRGTTRQNQQNIAFDITTPNLSETLDDNLEPPIHKQKTLQTIGCQTR
jgi:hypothetical protein